MILELLVVGDAPLIPKFSGLIVGHPTRQNMYLVERFGRKPTVVLTTTIMATCRQLHVEAVDILYTRNTFVYHMAPAKHVHMFMIRLVVLHISGTKHEAADRIVSLLKACPNITKLTLHAAETFWFVMEARLNAAEEHAALLNQVAADFKAMCTISGVSIPSQLELVGLRHSNMGDDDLELEARYRRLHGNSELYNLLKRTSFHPNYASLLQLGRQFLEMAKAKHHRVAR